MKKYVISPYLRLEKQTSAYAVVRDFIRSSMIRMKLPLFQQLSLLGGRTVTWEEACELFGSHAHWLKKHRVLLENDQVWSQHGVTTIEIETCTLCNWSCDYCPTKTDRKPSYMEESLFHSILHKALDYGAIKNVTLHGYNEPTLDHRLSGFMKSVVENGLNLRLYTNGSHMNEELFLLLQNYSSQVMVTFNCPSTDKELFHKMTGSGDYEHTMASIRRSLEYGIPTYINVQGSLEQSRSEAQKLKMLFSGAHVIGNGSLDRAGLLQNEYHDAFYCSAQSLSGCNIAAQSLFVNVRGTAYLCCNDYYHNYVLGSLETDSIQDVLESDAAVGLRRRIWGGQPAENNFICRKCAYIQYLESTTQRIV